MTPDSPDSGEIAKLRKQIRDLEILNQKYVDQYNKDIQMIDAQVKRITNLQKAIVFRDDKIQELDQEVAGLKIQIRDTKPYLDNMWTIKEEIDSQIQSTLAEYEATYPFWAKDLSDEDKFRYVMGPLPSDYGVSTWQNHTGDALAFECLWWRQLPSSKGSQFSLTQFPNWLHRAYDFEQDTSTTSGIALNVIDGDYPIRWGWRTARRGAWTFGLRFSRLLWLLHSMYNMQIPTTRVALHHPGKAEDSSEYDLTDFWNSIEKLNP